MGAKNYKYRSLASTLCCKVRFGVNFGARYRRVFRRCGHVPLTPARQWPRHPMSSIAPARPLEPKRLNTAHKLRSVAHMHTDSFLRYSQFPALGPNRPISECQIVLSRASQAECWPARPILCGRGRGALHLGHAGELMPPTARRVLSQGAP